MSQKRLLSIHDAANRRLLSIQDAATYLGLSARTLYNGTAPKSKNPFPVRPRRFGKRCLFDLRDLDEFIDSLPKGK
jgi:predicted DNA-binding transcriptional regulator AlpA